MQYLQSMGPAQLIQLFVAITVLGAAGISLIILVMILFFPTPKQRETAPLAFQALQELFQGPPRELSDQERSALRWHSGLEEEDLAALVQGVSVRDTWDRSRRLVSVLAAAQPSPAAAGRTFFAGCSSRGRSRVMWLDNEEDTVRLCNAVVSVSINGETRSRK